MTWADLARVRFSNPRARQLAERRLFRDCGFLAVNDRDPRALNLALLAGRPLTEYYWRQGEMDALAEQSHKI